MIEFAVLRRGPLLKNPCESTSSPPDFKRGVLHGQVIEIVDCATRGGEKKWSADALSNGQRGGAAGGASRRRDCHFADITSPVLLKHLLKVEGGAAE